MGDAWFTGFADELARCVRDAADCAEACEQLLERLQAGGHRDLQERVMNAVVTPTAVSRVLIELVHQPSQVVLATARLCRDSAEEAIARLDDLPVELETGDAIAALRAVAESCGRLVDAAD